MQIKVLLFLVTLIPSRVAYSKALETCVASLNCQSAGQGMLWLPSIIILQIGFAFLLLNKPHVIYGTDHGALKDSRQGQGWGIVQLLPVAVLLSFPTMTGLVMVDKWLWHVGFTEVFLVHFAYWWLLSRWWRRRVVGEVDEAPSASNDIYKTPSTEVASEINTSDSRLSPVSEELARDAAVVPAVAVPVPADTSIAATASLGQSASFDQLVKTYMWDTAGRGDPFRVSRGLSADGLITPDDLRMEGLAFVNGMRRIARKIAQGYRIWELNESGDQIREECDEIDSYLQDVMYRLTQSVLHNREHLFIDRNDVDVLGLDRVDRLYRIALFEVRFCFMTPSS